MLSANRERALGTPIRAPPVQVQQRLARGPSFFIFLGEESWEMFPMPLDPAVEHLEIEADSATDFDRG
jgi:hypothetical protein